MTRLFAWLAAACLVAGGSTAVATPAAAVPVTGIVQPAGSVPVPDGPAAAWVLADMDTGAVLAARQENGRFAPASTIKILLAMVVLDELPLDATVVADEADTRVECNCAGVAPGTT